MREIKFRAWCEKDKVMMYDLNSARLTNGELKDEMYLFMQYTGLKDKKGKEIYEGDLINLNYFNQLFEVKFGFHQTCLQDFYSSTAYGFYLSDNVTDSLGEERSFDEEKEYEIIGNIHQNQELLENKL